MIPAFTSLIFAFLCLPPKDDANDVENLSSQGDGEEDNENDEEKDFAFVEGNQQKQPTLPFI